MEISNQSLYTPVLPTIFVLRTKKGGKRYFSRAGDEIESSVVEEDGKAYVGEERIEPSDNAGRSKMVYTEVHLEEITQTDLYRLQTFGESPL